MMTMYASSQKGDEVESKVRNNLWGTKVVEGIQLT